MVFLSMLHLASGTHHPVSFCCVLLCTALCLLCTARVRRVLTRDNLNQTELLVQHVTFYTQDDYTPYIHSD